VLAHLAAEQGRIEPQTAGMTLEVGTAGSRAAFLPLYLRQIAEVTDDRAP
jgi:hypothetical protein